MRGPWRYPPPRLSGDLNPAGPDRAPAPSRLPRHRAGWTAATRCRQHGQRRRLLSLYEGQTIEFSVRNQNSGPPRFVIQSDGTNRIAEVFSCQPAKPSGKEKVATIARFTNTPIHESGKPATQRRTEPTITTAVKGSDQGARKITPRLETANERPASSQSRPTARIPSSPIEWQLATIQRNPPDARTRGRTEGSRTQHALSWIPSR